MFRIISFRYKLHYLSLPSYARESFGFYIRSRLFQFVEAVYDNVYLFRFVFHFLTAVSFTFDIYSYDFLVIKIARLTYYIRLYKIYLSHDFTFIITRSFQTYTMLSYD